MGDEIACGVVEGHGLGVWVMIACLGSGRFGTRDIVENSKKHSIHTEFALDQDAVLVWPRVKPQLLNGCVVVVCPVVEINHLRIQFCTFAEICEVLHQIIPSGVIFERILYCSELVFAASVIQFDPLESPKVQIVVLGHWC